MKNGKDTLVYLGTVDDVVLRHPWENINIKDGFLIETILDHVIFGNPLLINDGYLINHPLARNDLLKEKNSLILQLVKKGFIKVLTREDSTENLKNMPVKMAKDINSFKQATSLDDWKNFNECLGKLGDNLNYFYNCFKWPPVDMGDGFRILLENVSQSVERKGFESLGFRTIESDLVVRSINEIGNRLTCNTSGARNFYEQYCYDCSSRITNRQKKLFISDMMGLANEIYHFNFGINLDYHFRNIGSNVITETRFSKSFDDLLSIEENFHEFEKSFPLINAPEIINTLDPKCLSDLVDPSTDIGEAKIEFQSQMRIFSSGKLSLEKAKIASDKYKKSLSIHFSDIDPKRRLKNAINIGLNVTAGVVGAFVSGPFAISALAGSGIGLLSTFVGEPTLLRVTKKFKRKKLLTKMNDLNWEKYQSQKKYTNYAMIGALSFNKDITDPIANRVKKF